MEALTPRKIQRKDSPVQILDGVAVSKALREQIKNRATQFQKARGRAPGLSVVLVGDNPASHIYVRNKEKACEDVGIHSVRYDLPADSTFESLKTLLQKINADPKVDGILIQLPLPKHLNPAKVIALVDPNKDADCLTHENMGLLFSGHPRVRSCTPYAVMKILEHYGISTSGKKAVVIGKSNIVGKPMGVMLLDGEATVTTCHSKTKNLRDYTLEADIVVVAVGKPGLIGKADIKKDAVVIDVGINRLDSGKVCGDVRFDELKDWASFVTPVPKGVGPVTITMLLENTLTLAEAKG